MEFAFPKVEQYPYKGCNKNTHMVTFWQYFEISHQNAINDKNIRRRLFLPCRSFGSDELGEAIGHAPGEPRLGLDPDLNGLEGAEGDVGDDLGGGGAGEEDEGLVLGGVLGSGEIGVVLLEELVEAELAGALGAVAEQGRDPASEEALDALLPKQQSEAGADALVLGRIYLHVALDQIEWGHRHVGQAAAEDPAGGAGGVVRRGEQRDLALGRRRDHE